MPAACFVVVVKHFPTIEKKHIALSALRQRAAGFHHCQEHHTLNFDISKGGTLVNPELAFCPSSIFWCRSSVLLNEEQGLLQIQCFGQKKAEDAAT